MFRWIRCLSTFFVVFTSGQTELFDMKYWRCTAISDLMIIKSGINAKDANKAIKIIKEQVKRMQKGNFGNTGMSFREALATKNDNDP